MSGMLVIPWDLRWREDTETCQVDLVILSEVEAARRNEVRK